MELIFSVLWLAPFLMAVLLTIGSVVAVIGACNDFRVGLWVTAGAFALDTVSMSAPVLNLGLTVYAADLPMVLVALAAAVRWAGATDMPRRHLPWFLFALAFLSSFALGLLRYGSAAGVQARPDFYALAAASYALSFPVGRPQLRSMLVALAWVALVIAVLSVYRWVVYLTPIPSLLPPGGVYNIDGPMRVVNSNQALLLAQVALLGVFFFGSGLAPVLARLTAPALLMATLALQHRSVWLAGLVGACTSMLVARGSRTPWWQQALLVGIAAAAVAAPLVFSKTLSGQVQSSATRAVQGEGTVTARFDNWQVTLDQWVGGGPLSVAVGSPPGGDNTRVYYTENGQKVVVNFSTHNNYVHMLTSQGLLGLTMWCWVAGAGLLGLWRLRQAQGDSAASSASMLLVLLCSQMAYYVAYDVDYLQAFILGTAVAWVFQRQRELAGCGQPAAEVPVDVHRGAHGAAGVRA
ncbi:MAG: hypothetical protein RI988_101 [Pseudomonadota bacterium]